METDLKTDTYDSLNIFWELEAVRAAGWAEGLRIPSSVYMRAHTHTHTLTHTRRHTLTQCMSV